MFVSVLFMNEYSLEHRTTQTKGVNVIMSEKIEKALNEDAVTRSHYLLSSFVRNMANKQLTRDELLTIAKYSGILPKEPSEAFPITPSAVRALRDAIPTEILRDRYKDAGDSGNMSKEAILTEGRQLAAAYSELAKQNIQPLAATDTRFNGVFLGVTSNILYTKVEGDTILNRSPFFVGDTLLADKTERIGVVSDITKKHQRQLAIASDSLMSGSSLDVSPEDEQLFIVSPFEQVTEAYEMSRGLAPDTLRKARLTQTKTLTDTATRNFNVRRQELIEQQREKQARKSRGQSSRKAAVNTYETDYNKQGYTDDDIQFPTQQVNAFLGDLLSKQDLARVRERFSKVKGNFPLFSPEAMNRSRAILEHLYDTGSEFEIMNTGADKYASQLVIRLNDAQGTQVRLLDESKGSPDAIGRVHVMAGSLMFQDFQKRNWSKERVLALIDYARGSDNSVATTEMTKSDSKTSVVTVNGSRAIFIPTLARTEAITFNDAVDAEESLRENIEMARELYRTQLLSELDESLTATHDDTGAMLVNPELLDEADEDVAKMLAEGKSGETIALRLSRDVMSAQREQMLLAIEEATTEDMTPEEVAAVREAVVNEQVNSVIGSFEDGFDASKVASLNSRISSFNNTEAIVTAMKYVRYDVDKIKGTDFSAKIIKDRMITFDSSTARRLEDMEDGFDKDMMKHLQSELAGLGVVGFEEFENEQGDLMIQRDDTRAPEILMDDKGILQWEGYRADRTAEDGYSLVSTHIGQVFAPDEHGILRTSFGSGDDYGFIPGYRGYFEYSGLEDKSRMERFKAAGFEQTMRERITAAAREQVLRPAGAVSKSIQNGLDVVSLNSIYHKDVYGTRVPTNILEDTDLTPEMISDVTRTLRGRVRFGNQYNNEATTFAETAFVQKNSEEVAPHERNAIFDTADNLNMRIIHDDMKGYFDMVMTGTNKNQGMVVYTAVGAEWQSDGSLKPAEIKLDEKGEEILPMAPLRENPIFDYSKFNAWDRNQMAPNQTLTAKRIDEGVTSTLMNFGGWTFDDSYVISADMARRNQVWGQTMNAESKDVLNSALTRYHGIGLDSYEEVQQFIKGTGMSWSKEIFDEGKAILDRWDENRDLHEETNEALAEYYAKYARYRPLRAGDKISDYGGNKGTISLVVDREMSAEEAEAHDLKREVAIFKQNPDLDLVGSPYSMLSRHNAGVIHEMQDGFRGDVVDEEGNVIGQKGSLNVIVTDMLTDKKSQAYDEEAMSEGRGRKVSSQLVWILNEMGADAIVKEAFQYNDSAMASMREYLIATGYDMGTDGTMKIGYHPQGDEARHEFDVAVDKSSHEFLNEMMNKGGMLNLPFDIRLASHQQDETLKETNQLPILSASARSETELLDGEMKVHHYTRDYAQIYGHARNYLESQLEGDVEGMEAAKFSATAAVNNLQTAIVNDKLGGYNGSYSKHSHIRDKVMSVRGANSATAVATADPRLPLDTIAVSAKIYETLDLDPDGKDLVGIWRDPALRDGAFRAMKVVKDERIDGFAMNGVVDKSFDGDFDGDTYGIKKFSTPAAQKELREIAAMQHNLLDKGAESPKTYLNASMDVVTGAARAGVVEPAKEPLPGMTEEEVERFKAENPSPAKQLGDKLAAIALVEEPEEALQQSEAIIRKSVRNNFGGARVMLESKEAMMESLADMVKDGAKGNQKGLDTYEEYYDGKKGLEAAQTIQRASGIKSDATGLAGSYSQKLMALMRDVDPKVALETTYVITQGTLQIKHDADKGVIVNEILSRDLGNLLNGKPRNPLSKEEADEGITKTVFKEEMRTIYNDELNVDLRQEYLDALADTLADGTNKIVGVEKLMPKVASPLDQMAYGKGLSSIHQLAKDGRSIREGRHSGLMTPKKMHNPKEGMVLAKGDTQNMAKREENRMIRTGEMVKPVVPKEHAETRRTRDVFNAPAQPINKAPSTDSPVNDLKAVDTQTDVKELTSIESVVAVADKPVQTKEAKGQESLRDASISHVLHEGYQQKQGDFYHVGSEAPRDGMRPVNKDVPLMNGHIDVPQLDELYKEAPDTAARERIVAIGNFALSHENETRRLADEAAHIEQAEQLRLVEEARETVRLEEQRIMAQEAEKAAALEQVSQAKPVKSKSKDDGLEM